MEALWLINHSSGRGANAESRFLAFRWEGDYSKHFFWVLLCGPHIINSPVIAFHLLWGNKAKGYAITHDLPIINYHRRENTRRVLGSVKLVWMHFQRQTTLLWEVNNAPKVRRALFVTLDARQCINAKYVLSACRGNWELTSETKQPEREIQKSLNILKAHQLLSALQEQGKSMW